MHEECTWLVFKANGHRYLTWSWKKRRVISFYWCIGCSIKSFRLTLARQVLLMPSTQKQLGRMRPVRCSKVCSCRKVKGLVRFLMTITWLVGLRAGAMEGGLRGSTAGPSTTLWTLRPPERKARTAVPCYRYRRFNAIVSQLRFWPFWVIYTSRLHIWCQFFGKNVTFVASKLAARGQFIFCLLFNVYDF